MCASPLRTETRQLEGECHTLARGKGQKHRGLVRCHPPPSTASYELHFLGSLNLGALDLLSRLFLIFFHSHQKKGVSLQA